MRCGPTEVQCNTEQLCLAFTCSAVASAKREREREKGAKEHSLSSSFVSHRKRKREECSREKEGMAKWTLLEMTFSQSRTTIEEKANDANVPSLVPSLSPSLKPSLTLTVDFPRSLSQTLSRFFPLPLSFPLACRRAECISRRQADGQSR